MTLEFTIAQLFLAGPCAWSTLTSFSVFQCSYSVSMIGGSSRIRTHGPFRAFSFQDCCLKPCSAILPYCWCPGRDSNSQSLRQWLLRPPCIPFHHLGNTLHIETHSRSAARKALYPQWSMTRPNVFLYGDATGNRTPLARMKT